MSIIYFLIPVLNFIPLYALFTILSIVLYTKTQSDQIIPINKRLLSLGLVLPVVISIVVAFILDFFNASYGGSFSPQTELLVWIFVRTVLLIAPIPILIILGIFVYLFLDSYLHKSYKLYLLAVTTIGLSILSTIAGILFFPHSTAYLQAHQSLLVDIINLFLTIVINLSLLILYMVIRPYKKSEAKSKVLSILGFNAFTVFYDLKLLNYFRKAFMTIPPIIVGLYILFSEVLNSGLAIYIGGIFTFIPIVVIIILFLIFVTMFYGYVKNIRRKDVSMVYVVLILIILIVPSVMSFTDKDRELNSATTALENVVISSEPLDEYPIKLENIRLVDRGIAQDIANSLKLPEPPKSYRVEVMDKYQEIGFINGKAAWVVPIRYNEILGNPETNYIAGYISVDLNDPIPEDAIVRYYQMDIGPGLSGYRNIQWIIQQEHPSKLVGNIYLVDPWVDTNQPAWVVILDKLSPWGVRESDAILVVQANGETQTLTRQQALDSGLSLINSDASLKSIIDHGTKYLRGSSIDPSSRGYLWLPASSDVQQIIQSSNEEETDFYSNVHHFLMQNHIIGRERYMKVSTGSKESIVVWTAVNTTLKYYDFRVYSKGGISGVNSPTLAFSNLQQVTSNAGFANYDIRYPKLYKITNLIGNNSLLIWVSIVVEKRSGADRFAGMAFVDAANPRFSKFLSAQLGENPAIFKARFMEAINQTYLGFVGQNETIGGETITRDFVNIEVLGKEWTLLKPDNIFANILLINDTHGQETFIIVTENSVATKNDFYVASIARTGDRLNIKARWDSEAQGWLAISVTFP